MDKETLYDLRSLVALYPYYQTARLLMLQNLYILHSPSFDEELRKAAIYFTDRKIIFKLVEAAHYKLRGNADNTQKKYHNTPKAKAAQYLSLTNFWKLFLKTRKNKKHQAPNESRHLQMQPLTTFHI